LKKIVFFENHKA